jgi:hypothetical protein
MNAAERVHAIHQRLEKTELGSRVELVMLATDNVRGELKRFDEFAVTVKPDEGEEQTIGFSRIRDVAVFTSSKGPV